MEKFISGGFIETHKWYGQGQMKDSILVSIK